MTTSTPERHKSGRAPRYRMYAAEVATTRRLGPSFVRLTLTGDDLCDFGAGGPDQRVKLMLPQPGRTVADLPYGSDWHAAWAAMPGEVRPRMRTYTVRAYRPELAEIDIDFVLHGLTGGHDGPASMWASTARVGDRVGLVGPDRPGTGRMWGCEWCPPSSASSVLLAGDETAVPAMGAILESLPARTTGIACAEVPTAGDQQHWQSPPGVDVRWLIREDASDRPEHGALLEAAVSESLNRLDPRGRSPSAGVDDVDIDNTVLWDVPGNGGDEPEFYGWLAGEAGVIKRLRRMIVNDRAVPRGAVAFMGYWRRGRVLG